MCQTGIHAHSMHKWMHVPTWSKVVRTEQRHIEDNKLNSQKVAENNNSKNKTKDKQEAT